MTSDLIFPMPLNYYPISLLAQLLMISFLLLSFPLIPLTLKLPRRLSYRYSGSQYRFLHINVNQARNLITGKSAAKRVAHIWGPAGDQSVKKIKERIDSILAEYLVSNDMVETDKAIRDLAAPSFNYYVVKRAVLRALDSKDAEKDKLVKLLTTFNTSGLVSEVSTCAPFCHLFSP